MPAPYILTGPIGDDPPKAYLYYGVPALAGLKELPDNTVSCAISSPPYWGLRDYGTAVWIGGDPECQHKGDTCSCGAIKVDKQIGLEQTPEEYVAALSGIFKEVHRVLKPDGLLWLNLGDTYFAGGSTTEHGQDPRPYESKSTLESKHTAGSWNRPIKPRKHSILKAKDLVGIPWRVAFALQDTGWHLIDAFIWAKTNHMPTPVSDRLASSFEMLFLLGKSPEARLLQAVDPIWWINPVPYPESHFAVFPPALPKTCLGASLACRGIVLDPFSGSGTTGMVAMSMGHDFIGFDLNVSYLSLAIKRIQGS